MILYNDYDLWKIVDITIKYIKKIKEGKKMGRKNMCSIILIMVCAPWLFSACAFFGKSADKDDWYGAMGTRTYAQHEEHKVFMERQRLALAEREKALAERQQVSQSSPQSSVKNQYEGWLENKSQSTRTAQVIEVLRTGENSYRELGAVTAGMFEGRKSTKISLPEGYYIVKWFNGDRLVQTDKIMAAPHCKVTVVAGGYPIEYHFFSYCQR